MKLFAALREDTQQGWIWLQDANLPVRSIVKITNPANGKCIYCEALQIENNFLRGYNQSPRISITDPQAALVIGGWYRAALGNLSTQVDIPLNIKPSNGWWGKFKACIDHPQIIVRVAAWLGAIGLFLGIVGLVLGVLSLCPKA
ncbi:hypothetical protein [Candidatus Ferrigenium straubiae]|jgi:hypothetical protein|uniref:hypothetical protein n=1 Tax=Candidatus Ferrigenium straubiae TaxID=2919506 RepID=UPI003F4ABB8C